MNSENEVQEYFLQIWLTCEESQQLYNIACEWAKRAACTVQEIVEEIAYLVQRTAKMLVDVAGRILEELEESGFFDSTYPRARQRERERARIIEQKYRAEIRRCERERPYRRIYKPP